MSLLITSLIISILVNIYLSSKLKVHKRLSKSRLKLLKLEQAKMYNFIQSNKHIPHSKYSNFSSRIDTIRSAHRDIKFYDKMAKELGVSRAEAKRLYVKGTMNKFKLIKGGKK